MYRLTNRASQVQGLSQSLMAVLEARRGIRFSIDLGDLLLRGVGICILYVFVVGGSIVFSGFCCKTVASHLQHFVAQPLGNSVMQAFVPYLLQGKFFAFVLQNDRSIALYFGENSVR